MPPRNVEYTRTFDALNLIRKRSSSVLSPSYAFAVCGKLADDEFEAPLT